MSLPLFLLAGALALLVYGVARRLPLPPAERAAPARPLPFESFAQRLVIQAGVPVSGRLLVWVTLALAGVGALAAAPFQNRLLLLIASVSLGAAPYLWLRSLVRQRGRAVTRAAEPALVAIAKLCEVRRHPYLAIADALPLLQPPLKAEFDLALAQAQAGLPLPEALRQVARRCCDNFYLHQLAELVAINIRQGGNLSEGLERLAARLRTMEELRAEETAELFGYKWLTRLLLGASLAPLAHWAATGAPALAIYRERPLAQALLVWVVASGLVIASLPYWLAIDE